MYQPNVSHLHKGGGGPVLTNRSNLGNIAKTRPPLPTTKPPLRQTSLIPTKMQNLDSAVVSKFLQAVQEKPPVVQNSSNSEQFKSEYSFQPQAPQTSHLWKQPEKDSPLRTASEKMSNGSAGKPTPPWMRKSQEKEETTATWIKKEDNVPKKDQPSWATPKPTWNAKTLEKPKPTWSPKPTEDRNGHGEVANPINEVKSSVVMRVNKLPRETTDNLTSNGVTNRVSSAGGDWRGRFEDSERRRKELLDEKHRAEREKLSLERKASKLEQELSQLKAEHDVKCQQLDKLSQVSQKVYQDYDTLNNKYEVETTAMHRALQVASKWYLQNKKLRRESIVRSANDPSPLDETDGDDNELEELRKTVQDLSTQLGQLQSDLNSAKLQEFETQEQHVHLQQQFEEERRKNQALNKEVRELKIMREKFESVTVMVQGEVEQLRQQKDAAQEEVKKLRGESHEAKRERNVLQHQSILLMGDITPEDRLFKVLLEVEDLKRQLEESEHKHEIAMQEMQQRLEEKQSDSYIELLEGKLRVCESELQNALERAEQSEVSLQELKTQAKSTVSSSNGPPCPPPPPPPPPLPPMAGGINPPLMRPLNRRPTEGDSLEDMARLLGIDRTPKPRQAVAIDNIINEIKGGKFTLKATEKVTTKKEEQPAAVQEMLSIIGTLKRRPKSKGAIQV